MGSERLRVHGNRIIRKMPCYTSTIAYGAGDLVGTKITFSDVITADQGGGSIKSLVLTDKSKQNSKLDLLLFDEEFSTGTGTKWATGDNGALVVADSDAVNCIGIVNLATGDYSVLSANSIANTEVDIPFYLSGRHMFGLLVARGTPTYTSTVDLQLALGIERDNN